MYSARIEELRKLPRCGTTWPDYRPWPEGSGEWAGMLKDMDSIEGLLDLIKIAQPKRVLELGSSRGGSTEVFLLLCDEVVAMDPWGTDPERCVILDRVQPARAAIHVADMNENGRKFMEKCGHYQNLTVIRDYSPGGVEKLFPKYEGYFDLVYVDAIHEYQAVIDDVRAAWPLVRSGGWIAGHDYQPLVNFKDVIPAINAMFPQGVQTFSDSSWLIRKPFAPPDFDSFPKSANGDAPPEMQLPRPDKAYPPPPIPEAVLQQQQRMRARIAMQRSRMRAGRQTA